MKFQAGARTYLSYGRLKFACNFFSWQNEQLVDADRGVEITFTQPAIFMYDAVWSMALGLNATSAELPLICGSDAILGGYDPLQRGGGREVGRCVAALLTDRINALNFDGLSVSTYT